MSQSVLNPINESHVIHIAMTPFRIFLMIGAVITMSLAGVTYVDSRYFKKSDAKQKFAIIEKGLDRVYVHQLRTEAKEIIRDSEREKRPLTNSERNRLQDISEELRKFNSQLPVRVFPSQPPQ